MTADDESTPGPRQHWLGLLARATAAELDAAWARLASAPEFARLRPAETGLVTVRGRAGGTGQRFNLGEMTVTRASIRLADGTVGAGYVAGRNTAHTERVAIFDALLRAGRETETLEPALDAIEARLSAARQHTTARAQSTQVDFSTLAREAS